MTTLPLEVPTAPTQKTFYAFVGFEMTHESAVNWLARIRNCEPEQLTPGERQIAPIHISLTPKMRWKLIPIGPPRTYYPDGTKSVDTTHCILTTRMIRFRRHEVMTEADVHYVPDEREEKAENFLKGQGLSPSEYRFKWIIDGTERS